MELYAGIDLHSTSNYLGIIDEEDKRVYKKKLPNDLGTILQVLEPFKENLSGVAVESTFNWYWLVDGLMDNDYKMHLANPSAFQQYEGLKHTDDKWDSFWLAHMLRLGILPEGYIYPKEDRPIRDLLRRRILLVRHRTAHLLSLQSMISRVIGIHMSGNQIKKLKEVDAKELFDHPYLVMAAQNSISVMGFLKERIMVIEKAITSKTKVRDEFKSLQTIPGVGKVLTLTIMLEVGDINRFAKVGNYSSYCRCVKSERFSDGKKKGKGNKKNGNKFLAWAYIETANFARRYCPYARKFFQRKEAKTNGLVAIKALSNKIARASYYIMRDQVEYDPGKLFG
jgi:transposase